MNTATMTALRASMTGEIVPGEKSYERLRNTFAHTGTPAIVVRCHDTGDVQRAVRHARDNDLVLSLRSGGFEVTAQPLGQVLFGTVT